MILGGQDGLVNVLGIVLGVAAASGDTRILIAASLAATFAESISMGAVAYTSSLAEKHHYEKEVERENWEIDYLPDRETREIRDIYSAKGFSGRLLDEIVAKVTSDRRIWLDIMMREELDLAPIDTRAVLRTSAVVAAAAVVGSLIPVLPFFFLSREFAIPVAVVAAAAALFVIGAYEAKSYVGVWWQNGLRLAAIGLTAAVVGFLIGHLFQAP